MPDTLTDIHDHFTEVFGSKRGAVRPDDIDGTDQRPNLGLPLKAGNEERGPLCAGTCGKHVMPATADDCGGDQEGPWYCPECFGVEKARREARKAERAARQAQGYKPAPTNSRLKVMAEGATLCIIAVAIILGMLCIAAPSLMKSIF